MESLPAEDRDITEVTPWGLDKKPEPAPNQVRAISPASATGGIFHFLTDQFFGKFNRKVKTCIRWFALLVAISFGLNHGSEQLKRTACHWRPHSTYFCENPTPRSPSPEIVSPAIEGGWILSTGALSLIVLLVFSLWVCLIGVAISEHKDAKKVHLYLTYLGLIILMGLLLISIFMLIEIIPLWF